MAKRIFRGLALTGSRMARDPSVTRVFGALLRNPNLWHINRRSVSWAISVGLFMAFVPVPFQMLLAAGAAILIGCNLPIAVATVWVSNPFTMGPMFFAAYKLGAWTLSMHPRALEFELTLSWLMTRLVDIWQPFLLGCFLLGSASALLGQALVRLVWRLHVVQAWRSRRARAARVRDS